MKYIDAEKLKEAVEEKYNSGDTIDDRWDLGYDTACEQILSIIASLQQEPRFPQYDNIVDKVFGAGNLEFWERDEAEMLVALAKEELLKSIQQEPEIVEFSFNGGTYRKNGEEHTFKGGRAKVIILEINQEEGNE